MLGRSIALGVALVIAVPGTLTAQAPAASKVTHKGVEMPVKSAVAVWDAESLNLKLYLLSIEAGPDLVKACQQGDVGMFLFMRNPPSPDPAKWPKWVPRAEISVSWFPSDRQAVGDIKKSRVRVYLVWVGYENANTSVSFSGDKPIGSYTLTGKLQEGQEVAFALKGSGTDGGEAVSWDVNVKAKLLAPK